MARIRSIKPEFPDSESMGKVSRDARLLFLMMITQADDEGRIRGNHRFLAHKLLPYDQDAEEKIGTWLTELESQHCIQTYHYEGHAFVAINHWARDQKIDHPYASRLPAPPRLGQIELFNLEPDQVAATDKSSEIARARAHKRREDGG